MPSAFGGTDGSERAVVALLQDDHPIERYGARRRVLTFTRPRRAVDHPAVRRLPQHRTRHHALVAQNLDAGSCANARDMVGLAGSGNAGQKIGAPVDGKRRAVDQHATPAPQDPEGEHLGQWAVGERFPSRPSRKRSVATSASGAIATSAKRRATPSAASRSSMTVASFVRKMPTPTDREKHPSKSAKGTPNAAGVSVSAGTLPGRGSNPGSDTTGAVPTTRTTISPT